MTYLYGLIGAVTGVALARLVIGAQRERATGNADGSHSQRVTRKGGGKK